MPTASIKAEKVKQPSLEASEPLRQGITIVEHKIRNLEKRKTKLDSYKALQASGKELNSDQLIAVQKYEEVIQTLEFAKDLCKQLNTLATESAKAHKKQLRKEAAEKVQQEIARTKEILIIQDVLSNMGQDQVREDLTEGKAKVTVTSDELSQIDQLFIELSPKQEEPPLPYLTQFQSPAEQMHALLEGKNREAFGTTYAALKTKLMDIANSGYFDPTQPEQPTPAVEVQPQPEETVVANNVPVVAAPVEELSDPAIVTTIAPSEPSMPLMQEVSHLESQLIQQQQAAAAAAAGQHHLNVFKSGPIDFIQENEVEESENDNSIPTLTYTNQNYTPSKAPLAQPVEQPANDEWEEQPVEHAPPAQTPQINQQDDSGWEEAGDNGGWQEANNHWQTQSHHHNQHQSNDGFIQAGGGRGRGGRGRGGRGGPNRPQQNRPSRGGYNREGGYNRDGGYNRENREGGYNKEGQSYYQNGYRGGGGERRGGNTRNFSDRGERGGGGRGGPRGRGSNPNYRGSYNRQQQ